MMFGRTVASATSVMNARASAVAEHFRTVGYPCWRVVGKRSAQLHQQDSIHSVEFDS